MRLPISFEEVAYYNNGYRGDLIITKGVLYYFAHTNVVDERYGTVIRGDENAQTAVEVMSSMSSGIALLIGTINLSVKTGKFLKRNILPTTNKPQIKKLDLWNSREDNNSLQGRLDNYIEQIKNKEVDFDEYAVIKPVRIEAGEVQNLSTGMKLKFDAQSDTHDFRVHLLQRKKLKGALHVAGFIKLT